jgi:hypothetical protein
MSKTVKIVILYYTHAHLFGKTNFKQKGTVACAGFDPTTSNVLVRKDSNFIVLTGRLSAYCSWIPSYYIVKKLHHCEFMKRNLVWTFRLQTIYIMYWIAMVHSHVHHVVLCGSSDEDSLFRLFTLIWIELELMKVWKWEIYEGSSIPRSPHFMTPFGAISYELIFRKLSEAEIVSNIIFFT